jgi:hypothetical protein
VFQGDKISLNFRGYSLFLINKQQINMKKIIKYNSYFILALIIIYLILDTAYSLHVFSYCDSGSGSIQDFIIDETLDTNYELRNIDNKDVQVIGNTNPNSINLGITDRIRRIIS